MAKAVNGEKSEYYDPTRKTVIYFHGWTGSGDGWTRICKRVTGRCPAEVCRDEVHPLLLERWLGDGWTRICKRVTGRCPAEVCRDEVHPLLLERWLDDGWNVGFFYWDQFADEDCTRDAEQKIWFDRDGHGFEWKSHDVGTGLTTIRVLKEKTNSLGDLCADHIG